MLFLVKKTTLTLLQFMNVENITLSEYSDRKKKLTDIKS